MKLARIVAITVLLSLLTGAGGCDRDSGQSNKPQPSSQSKSSTGGTIGVSVLTMTNPFFKEIAETITSEAKKNGMDVIVVSGEFDPSRQYGQVKEFLVKKVSAIVLTPCDSKAVGAAIKEANAAGIPVFTADIACVDPDAKVVCHVATDNYSGGREAAKAMMKGLSNKGKVAIIDHPVVESVMMRTKGFRDELAAAKSPIQVVGAYPGKGSKDESFKVTQDILTANKDLAGIFAINDPSALGAYAAIEKNGLAGKVLIVGFDGQLEGKQAIRDGRVYADPIQFPDQIGRETVSAIVKYTSGERVPPQVLIPTQLYFKEDAAKDPSLK
ncbi:MAG TPA: substrate-binding domain-containing protein [Tepidisphaeraceae bacterium]|jgi:ribose transport system substrate-binding protein